ncbi:MAG: RDD family protein [Clostridia bacterium]|nr:RDD family protein [Clostridia bacterium]
MTISIQKANFWKRISAYLFDTILVVMLSIGLAALLSVTLGYDKSSAKLEEYYVQYEQTYGVDLDISNEDYDALSEDEKANFQAARDAFGKDPEVVAVYGKIISLTLVIVTLSVFVAVLAIYFIVPLFFKNGQTLGKKVFGLAVVRSNAVKASTPVLFVRSMLGLYTIETMFPLLILVLIYFGIMGIVGTVTILLLLALQVGVLIKTKYHSSIHDLLSDTIVVDAASQRIFPSQEALNEFIREEGAREAQAAEY